MNAPQDPLRAALERFNDAHWPFIKFGRDGLPYLVCNCGWDDTGDLGWGDHIADALPAATEPADGLELCPDCEGTGYVRHSGDMHFRVGRSEPVGPAPGEGGS